MKKCAVVVRSIDEAIASWHVYRVGARDVVSAHFRLIVQMQSRAIGPPGNDGLAGLVLLYRVRGCRRLLDLRGGQALALLNVENGVIGQHERAAAVFVLDRSFILRVAVAELLIENDLSTLLTF